MLELKNIYKTFNAGTVNEKQALKGIDLTLEDGDFVTVIGGNGAGKSTMLNAIAGVWPVDEGQIIIDGKNVTNLPEHKRAAFLGRVFQDPMNGTAATMGIEENLALALRRGQSRTLRAGIKASEREVYKRLLSTLGLGLEDRLVATAGLDNEVPDELKDAFSKTNYLDEFTPSLETVTMLEPDMILSWSSLFSDKNLGNVTDWIDKGCNTYYNTNTRPDGDRTLENDFTDILNLGKIFDVQDKAQAIVDDAKAVIDKTLTATADVEEKPSVMVLEPLGEDITNYGAKSLGGDMVTQLGATLANPDASTAGKEDIIAANPDVIFVVYMPYAGDDPETVKESQLAVIKDDEALQSLDAVKNGRVYPIMLSEMYASATRTQDGIETFAKGLYPDVNLD